MSRQEQQLKIIDSNKTPIEQVGQTLQRIRPNDQTHQEQMVKEKRSNVSISSNNEELQNLQHELPESGDEQEKFFLREDEGLFGDPIEQVQKVNIDEDASKEWSTAQFLESFMYHAVFFIFLGPMCNLIFFRKPGLTMMRNLGFYGLQRNLYFQSFIYVFSLNSILLYFLVDSNVATFEELLLVWFVLSFRCVAISAKYATFTKEQWQSLKTTSWNIQEIREQLYLGDWRGQAPKLMYQEIESSIERHQYETTDFWFKFITPPSLQTKKQLQQTTDILMEVMSNKVKCQRKLQISRIQNESYCGYQIILHLLRGFGFYGKSLSLQLSFLWAFVTILTVFITLGAMGKLAQEQQLDVVRHVINSLNLLYGIGTSYCFLIEALRDLDRKTFLMKQCCYLISPNKLNLGVQKMLPTLNPVDPDSLDSWSMVRGISMDFGQKYYLRTQGFFSLVLLFCLAEFVVVLLIITNIYVPAVFTLVVVGEQALLHWLLVVLYMLKGAMLNSYFDKFRNLLDDTQSLFVDILKTSKTYFQENKPPSNAIHRRSIQLIVDLGYQQYQEFEKYCESLIRKVKNGLNKLDYDERNNSVKLYGVPMSFILLQSVGVGLGTVLGFAAQQRMQNKFFSDQLSKQKTVSKA